MFVGHYSVAFAAKSEKNRIPLWVLFVAVQFLDYIWATLVLLGIEKLRVTAMAWSGVAALLYKTIWRAKASSSAAVIVGLAAFSHWILDLIAHPRDLAIYDDTWKVGFGLWNYRDPEFALEIALLAGGIIVYLARNVMPPIRKTAIIGFGIVLVIVQIGDTYVPRAPLTDKATAMGVWIFYTLFVLIAFLVEKVGNRRQINVS